MGINIILFGFLYSFRYGTLIFLLLSISKEFVIELLPKSVNSFAEPTINILLFISAIISLYRAYLASNIMETTNSSFTQAHKNSKVILSQKLSYIPLFGYFFRKGD